MSGIKTYVSRGSAPIQSGSLTRALALPVALAVLTTLSYAQGNFAVIHNFTGSDGANPYSAPTLDRHGNLYGTTPFTSLTGEVYGNVYQLAPVNGSWILHPLYDFMGYNGGNPYAGVTIGPDGTLFGATAWYGPYGDGTVYNVKPPASACGSVLCSWSDTTLHTFSGGGNDGANPFGNVVFDSQGNLYGTTASGGTYNGGTVYEGTRSGGTWNVSVIYSFGAYAGPGDGLVVGSAGNLYGTTPGGGAYGYGTVFELSPSQGGWSETVLHSFTESDEGCIQAGLVFDRAGNLYGASQCGTIFELSPQGGGWNFTTIYTFAGNGPPSTLAIDAAGNLYGTTINGGSGGGNAFELSPSADGWTYTDLHDFSGNDGASPVGGVAVTGPGEYLYGTTRYGGTDGDGVVYQINLGAR